LNKDPLKDSKHLHDRNLMKFDFHLLVGFFILYYANISFNIFEYDNIYIRYVFATIWSHKLFSYLTKLRITN